MLHGIKSAKDSENTARKTFEEKSIGKDLPTIKIKRKIILNGINIFNLVLHSKLTNSKSEIRRMIKNNGLRINNKIINDEKFTLKINDIDKENKIKISHGKKQHVVIEVI